MPSLIKSTRVLIHLSTHRCEILFEMPPLSIGTNLKDTAHDVLSLDRRPETVWKMNKRPRGIPQDICLPHVVDTCGGHLTQANYFNLL